MATMTNNDDRDDHDDENHWERPDDDCEDSPKDRCTGRAYLGARGRRTPHGHPSKFTPNVRTNFRVWPIVCTRRFLRNNSGTTNYHILLVTELPQQMLEAMFPDLA